MLVTSIFSFFHNVFKRLFLPSRLSKLLLYRSEFKKMVYIPCFNDLYGNARWDKEKLLIFSFVLFSHNVFYSFQTTFNLMSADVFEFGLGYFFCYVGKSSEWLANTDPGCILDKRNIDLTKSLWCIRVHACIWTPIWTITFIFMYEFQKNMAQFFSLPCRSAI